MYNNKKCKHKMPQNVTNYTNLGLQNSKQKIFNWLLDLNLYMFRQKKSI